MADWESGINCEILRKAMEEKAQDEIMPCAGCMIRYCPITMAACDVVGEFKGDAWKKLGISSEANND